MLHSSKYASVKSLAFRFFFEYKLAAYVTTTRSFKQTPGIEWIMFFFQDQTDFERNGLAHSEQHDGHG